MNYKLIIKVAISSSIFTIVCLSMVVIIASQTKDKVADNKKLVIMRTLNQLVSDFDNDILSESQLKTINLHGRTHGVVIYQAKKAGNTFAKLIQHTYPKGYNGDIMMLTAIDNDNKIIGTRILNHSETPGLGDKIEIKKSSWITNFDNLSLDSSVWKIKKRGGDFDSWSGASITPSAIITAIQELLQAIKNEKI